MKTKSILLFFVTMFVLCGCKKDPQEIFNEQKSGVVLICNEFYYDIALSSGSHIYFSGLDADGDFLNLTFDLPEIKRIRIFSMGQVSSLTIQGASLPTVMSLHQK